MQKFPVIIATFFGSGLSPIMPGTVGSFASLAIWAPLAFYEVSWIYRLALLAVISVMGTWACQNGIEYFNNDDPKSVVIDEVAGQGLALLLTGASIPQILAGFALFRLFDIWKPWPISYIQKNVKGGLGVMVDDLVAGLIALVILNFLVSFSII